jgi:hypothetical protein
LLVYDLQHHSDRTLQDLIFEGWYAERSRFRAAPLRDMDPTNCRRSIRAGLCAIKQRSKIVFQVRRILLSALPVYAASTVFASALVRLAQPIDVDVVGEIAKRHAGRFLRQFRYSLEFR